MKSILPLFSCALLSAMLTTSLFGQSATDLNEGLKIRHDKQTDSFTISWWGRAGFIYFIQQSDNLKEWNYIPVSHLGADQLINYGFNTNARTSFFRLVLTDDPNTSLWKGDFDGDGISNGDEVLAGMDPFTPEPFADSDNDGLPDYWEMFYFGNLAQNGDDSFAGDGISNRDKYENGINPSVSESQFSELRIEYSYDVTGKLIRVESPSIETTYTLDKEGNVLSVQ